MKHTTDDISEDLIEKIRTAVRRKLFFAHDIANVIKVPKPTVLTAIYAMIDRGILRRDDSGEPTAFYLADDRAEETGTLEGEPFELSETPPEETTRVETVDETVNLTETEINGMIFEAIDARYCTLTQIKRFNKWTPAFDVGRYLEKLVDGGNIVKLENEIETASGFFRVTAQPVRTASGHAKFSLNGENLSFEIESVEQYRRREEKWSTPVVDATDPNGFLFDKPPANAIRDPGRGASGKRKPKVIITPEQMEEAARTCRNQTAIAKHFGVHENTIYTKLGRYPDLKAAYERGVLSRKHSPEPVGQPADPAFPTAAGDVDSVPRKESDAPISVGLPALPDGIAVEPRHAELIDRLRRNGNESTKRGIAATLREMTVEHAGPGQANRLPELTFEMDSSPFTSIPGRPGIIGVTRAEIGLSDGGMIGVEIDANLFDLDETEFVFTIDLIRQIRAFPTAAGDVDSVPRKESDAPISVGF